MTDKPRYFPVPSGPLRMRAGLFRLGKDFGNGAADGRIFQRDSTTAAVLEAKRRVLEAHPERYAFASDVGRLEGLRYVLDWMNRRAAEDTGSVSHVDGGVVSGFDVLARQSAEDFVILQRDECHGERCVLAHVCFPSGWRPERIVGKGFLAIHDAVPAFEEVGRSSRPLVDAIFERGPYVRFVWTVTPGAELDRHPSLEHADWQESQAGFLRVERQISVPFAERNLSLFVIRLHVYSFAELSASERAVLASCLRQTADEILTYKGLASERARIVERLESGEREEARHAFNSRDPIV